ncbi:hypothetical protein FB45DRAFT_917749 [Roridomyces roridus]|uniref:Uncharacterized protein n=1 Tax=Roridomyces roridus TaxID=1738132 RepID=A0AAD7FQ02_9AGAR|nr:hypothetical protein FB45DRAFT_917749 [Roridomyces roridus]
MSFQHFRLGDVPVPAHLASATTTVQTFQTPAPSSHVTPTKQPYGSGDTDDYNLVFPNLEAFHAWRDKEEETQMVEFVKGDTHGSKAVPPRFKDHTKLVCARHSRSGRKKYVKKHPERVRKVPSRKIEGEGCSASISFKTYYDTEEVRACYVSQHSHETGLANLPFTRRGRKAAAQQEKETGSSRKQAKVNHGASPGGSGAAAAAVIPDTAPQDVTGNQATEQQQMNAISMLAPLPPQPVYNQQPHYPNVPYAPPVVPAAPSASSLSHDRWENMATLFETARGHARTFEFPMASVAALESILIRLYLESPVAGPSAPMFAPPNHNPNIQPNLGEASLTSGQDDA